MSALDHWSCSRLGHITKLARPLRFFKDLSLANVLESKALKRQVRVEFFAEQGTEIEIQYLQPNLESLTYDQRVARVHSTTMYFRSQLAWARGAFVLHRDFIKVQ